MVRLLYQISYVLVIIGALNWGLVGTINMDLVATVLGKNSVLSKIVYVLVGIAAIYMILVKLGLIK